MEDRIVNPAHWPADYLIAHGEDVIHDLALKSAGTLNSYRLLLGRCLLAVDRTRLYEKFSCSGAIHYAVLVLGLRTGEARTLRRVAGRLEELPHLSVAAELGRIPWGKLREIVRKASAKTEEFWLELVSRMSYHQIERLVRATAYGKLPWEANEETDDPTTRLQLCMTAETNEMFKRAVGVLSRRFEKVVSPAEALEHLLVDYLAKDPVTSDIAAKAKKEAGKDVAAAKHGRAKLVLQAWELSQEFRAGHRDEDPLETALGGQPILASDPHERPARAAIHLERDSGPGCSDETEVLSEMTSVLKTGCESETNESVSSPDKELEAGHKSESKPSRWTPPVKVFAVTVPKAGQPARVADVGDCGSLEAKPARQDGIGRPIDASHILTDCLAGSPAMADRPISPEFLELLQSHDWKNGSLRFNPKARLATLMQRRELMRRDGYCCATPGCPNHTWLELHHVVWACDDGETVTYNLVTLCTQCHGNVHKGLLKIEGNADNGLTFRDSEGRDLARVYGLEVAGWLNLHIGWVGGPGHCYMQQWAAEDGPPLGTAENVAENASEDVPEDVEKAEACPTAAPSQ